MPKHPQAPPPSGTDELGLERIVFFTDAVMAIALTLLAIDIRVPELPPATAAAELPAALVAIGPRILSFAISFLVVGVYWMSHHRYFTHIKRYDNRLILFNLLFLLLIAFMPFIASLFGQYSYLNLVIGTYALAVALIGFSLALVWWHASHNHHLVDKNMDSHRIHMMTLTAFIGPTIFLLSAPLALVNPIITVVIWCISPFVSLTLARSFK